MRRLLLLTFLFIGTTVRAQGDSLRIVSWNVENLFDSQHDSLHQDQEFLPEGSYHWTPHRYWKKLREVGRTLMALGGERLPDMVALCEVENDTVMRDLTRRSPLRDCHFQYVMTDSPDLRGVDVALLYQPTRFRLLGCESWRVPSAEHQLPPTRDLLHCWGLQPDGDTLHVIVCHLPSRLGGRKNDRNRMLAARTLATLADSIGKERRVGVMGDFNAAPRDRIFRTLAPLVDLMPQQRMPAIGSYYFRKRWSWIDHFLVSPGVSHSAVHLGLLPWLKETKEDGTWLPYRTFRGPIYHGGVSDHLPIVLSLPLKQ